MFLSVNIICLTHKTTDRPGYSALEQINEYFYELSDKDLLALVVQVTGVEENNAVAKLILSTFKALKAFASFEAKDGDSDKTPDDNSNSGARDAPERNDHGRRQGLRLSYTINLNLPATTDQAVFNAIFRSLKEHLIADNE